MKFMIWTGITIGGLVGGWLGGILDHGNMLGGWSILLGLVGSIAGLWAGFKVGQSIDA